MRTENIEHAHILAIHEHWLRFGGKKPDLRGAYLRGADLRDAVPVIPSLDSAILAAITKTGCSLDMGTWHTCETTHCRAGWAITLAGKEGAELEDRLGPAVAGALIYQASTGRNPDFYASTEDALEDIRKGAEREATTDAQRYMATLANT